MRSARFRRVFLLVPLAFCAAGCLIISDDDKVVRRKEPRTVVRFESDAGMLRFVGHFNRHSGRDERSLGEGSLMIPFIAAINQERVLAKNAYYNDQVEAADVDANGTLSDAEVNAFVGTAPPVVVGVEDDAGENK